MANVKALPAGKTAKHVPVVIQMEEVECGAACLTMIFAHYGSWVSLEQMRQEAGVSRDGSTAQNLVNTARNFGFDAEGYTTDVETLKTEVTFPCIIHWNFEHFVVLRGFKGNYALLNDPAYGDVKVPMKEFNKSFTGIVIMMTPGEEFEPQGEQKKITRFIMNRLKGHWNMMIGVFAIGVVIAGLGVLSPLFDEFFLDKILDPLSDAETLLDTKILYPFLIAFGVYVLLMVTVSAIQSVSSLRIQGKLDAEGSSRYMWKVLNLPIGFFSQRSAGDIRERQDTNAEIATTLIDTLAPLLIDAVLMIVYFVLMITNSVILTSIGIVTVLLHIIFSIIISKSNLNFSRVSMRDNAKMISTMTSGFEMMETIKSSGAEDGFFEKWSSEEAACSDLQSKNTMSTFGLGTALNFIANIADSLVVIVGIYLVIKGDITAGLIMAFQGFLGSFLSPALTFISAGDTIYQMRADMERVEDILQYPSDTVFAEEEELPEGGAEKLSGCIDMKNVTFGYSPLAEPLIYNFNLHVDPGMQVAIVGGSGCGKSTVTKLLSGLYEPWEGEILFDGKPLTEIPRSVFKSSLAVVEQDIIMFDDTISANLKMWDNTIENFEIIMAARDAQVHDEIMQRPGGYNYRLIEGGYNFSGGQRQRMEIARVLAQDPTIMIMDEATSALDAKTEYNVVQSVRARGCTCIIVAHRLSTIRNSDIIVMLDDGIAIDAGTHDELMERCEPYRALVTGKE